MKYIFIVNFTYPPIETYFDDMVAPLLANPAEIDVIVGFMSPNKEREEVSIVFFYYHI